MFNNVQVVFLAAILSALHIQGRAQDFYSTYNTPYQNSFAFATPNLKQVFTTKLASGSRIQPFSQQLQDQQAYNLPQQNIFANYPQQYQQQQAANLPNNLFQQNGGVFSTTPQQFPVQDDQLRQQLAYYQQQQQLQQQIQLQQQQGQQQQQYLEQFQAPFVPSQRDAGFERQANQEQAKEQVRTQHLLGVAYSPSTQVSQVKFDNGKLKYDF